MLPWILLGYSISVLIVYIVLSEDLMAGGELWWKKLVCAVLWPIVLLVNVLVWLVCQPILRPMWAFIGKGFVLLGRGLVFLFGPILRPIAKRISALWSRWIDYFPEPKRPWIRSATIIAIFWGAGTLLLWFAGDTILAIIYSSVTAAALITMLVIYLRVKAKKVNSSC